MTIMEMIIIRKMEEINLVILKVQIIEISSRASIVQHKANDQNQDNLEMI